MFVAFFIFALAVTAYAISNIPKTPQKETELSDLGVTTASPGRLIPIAFGTVLVKSPNVVWYGHLRKEKVYAD